MKAKKVIALNEQQVEFLIDILDFDLIAEKYYSRTTIAIAKGIVDKLNEEEYDL